MDFQAIVCIERSSGYLTTSVPMLSQPEYPFDCGQWLNERLVTMAFRGALDALIHYLSAFSWIAFQWDVWACYSHVVRINLCS